MAVSIKEVRTKRDLRQFAKFPNVLYKNNKYYVPQLISMDMATFSPKINRAFEVCEGKYWLAYKDGELVGRVAGIINHKYNRKVGQNICRFGWIDFTNNPEVVHALLDTVESYARANGMNVVEGPVGFLEFDVAGVLVDGFDQYPTAYGKYNDPYYEPLILAEGYKKETDYVEYRVTVPEDIDRYVKLSKLIGERLGLHEATFKNKKDLVRKYADGIFGVLNHAYSSLHGFSELSQAQCEDLKKEFLPQLILDYVSVIVDKDDKVVAFGITLPSLSKALIKAKGHLFPFGWYHILHALKHNDTIDALLVAISDEYKDKGVNAMLIAKMGIGYHRHGIKYLESTRELESNMAVQNMWGHFERKLHKRARVYIKEIQ